MGSPVALRIRLTSAASSRSRAHASSVLRHCHPIAGASGLPVARSQATTVSPWLVKPSASTSEARMPERSIALWVTRSVAATTSSASISTHPGRGKLRGMVSAAADRVRRMPWPSASSSVARTLVVP